MSDDDVVSALECSIARDCQYTRYWLTKYMALAHHAPWLVLGATFVGSLLTNDVSLLVLSGGLSWNLLLGYLLAYLFRSAAPQRACGDGMVWCGARCTYVDLFEWVPLRAATLRPDPALYGDGCVPCGVPNVAVSHTAFLMCSLLYFAFQYNAPLLRPWHRVGAVAAVLFVAHSEEKFGFSSGAQVLASACVGAANALLYRLVTYYFLQPYFDCFVRLPLVRALAYKNFLERRDAEDPGAL